mgnify:FL=1
MKKFIARKKIKVPRYKIYYFLLACSVFFVFILNIFVSLVLKSDMGNTFLQLLASNSLGGIINTWDNASYVYQNVFGLDKQKEETVSNNYDSIENVVVEENKDIVYIYNTFQTDKYKSNYFNSYSVSSYVTQASFMLKEYLSSFNIGSIVEEESVVKVLKEQNIMYSNTYAASRILMEEASKNHPDLEMFFDLQVSDYEREATTVEIDGENYAKILFVVGTDNGTYLENQEFATELNGILESINPALSRGVSLRGGVGYQGVYNQDFSSKVLLIQVGGINNTIDEVNRSMKILAEVIATYKEENDEEG